MDINKDKCPRCGSDERRSLNEYKEVTLRDGYNRVHYSINKYICENCYLVYEEGC